MPGDAGHIDNRSRSLLLHDRQHRLHGFHRAEKVCFERLAHLRHVDARRPIQNSVAGIVNPDVDPQEMMHGQANDAVDFFAIAHVAGKRKRLIDVADS